eukprot:jgi/Botrbrau1/1082/Bobra.0076s0046.1
MYLHPSLARARARARARSLPASHEIAKGFLLGVNLGRPTIKPDDKRNFAKRKSTRKRKRSCYMQSDGDGTKNKEKGTTTALRRHASDFNQTPDREEWYNPFGRQYAVLTASELKETFPSDLFHVNCQPCVFISISSDLMVEINTRSHCQTPQRSLREPWFPGPTSAVVLENQWETA